MRILIADDSEPLREMFAEAFEDAGHEVLRAPDGQEALRLIELHGPDVAIMDVSMPVLDGLKATRILRSTPEIAKTLVIACCGVAPQPDARALFDAIVCKPIVPSDLVKLALELLANTARR